MLIPQELQLSRNVDQRNNLRDFIRSVIILEDLTYESSTCPLMLPPPVFNPSMHF